MTREWLSVGGGFGPEAGDALIASFMRNASTAADFLCGAVTGVVLERGDGPAIEELYIVFENHSSGAEYELRQMSENQNGTRI